MPINPFKNNNFIDSCAFDPKYKPEDEASNEIFRFYKEGKFYKEEKLIIQIAHSTHKEIEHPNTPIWVKQEASRLIQTMLVPLTEIEKKKLRQIEKILTGNGKVENILQDARHIFETQKYGSYFITTDARILARAYDLRLVCDAIVLKPSEFIDIVKHYVDRQSNEQIFRETIKSAETPNIQDEAMVDSVNYKGYSIRAVPDQLVDSGRFTLNIYILHYSNGSLISRNFQAFNTFETEQEAICHCIEFGRRIIDGKIQNCTVADL